MNYNELHKELMSKKSKYEKHKVAGWDDSEGFLSHKQIEIMLDDEKANQLNDVKSSKGEIVTFTDEYLDFVYKHSSRIKTSEKNKSLKVFPLDEPEHQKMKPDDLDSTI